MVMPRSLAAVLVTLASAVAVYFGLLFFAQRRLLFQPPWTPTMPSRPTAEIVRLATPAGPAEALFLAPTGALDRPAPLLLWSHGNAELATDWVSAFDEPRSWGWAVLLLEYPGYGRSPGAPSERSITAAALAAYDWARADPRIDSTRIVPYGRSLGGGPATRLAVERPAAALILESAFTSVRAFAGRFFAPRFLVRDPFDNLSALRSYHGPLLVLHGSHDEVVPVAHGRALAGAVEGAELHELPCGHNDCPRSWQLVRRFLLAHGLMAEGGDSGPRHNPQPRPAKP